MALLNGATLRGLLPLLRPNRHFRENGNPEPFQTDDLDSRFRGNDKRIVPRSHSLEEVPLRPGPIRFPAGPCCEKRPGRAPLAARDRACRAPAAAALSVLM